MKKLATVVMALFASSTLAFTAFADDLDMFNSSPAPTPTQTPSQKSKQQQNAQKKRTQTTQAQPQRRTTTSNNYHHFYIGGLAGLGVPASGFSGIGSHFMFGANANYRFTREFGMGAYFLHSSGSGIVQGEPATFSLSFYGVEGTYFFRNGFNLGLRLGLAPISTSVTESFGTLTANTSSFSLGPKLGYDYWIPHSSFTLGAELGFIFVMKPSELSVETQYGAVNYQQPFFAIISGLATIKYWF
jgi:hypothetical protein